MASNKASFFASGLRSHRGTGKVFPALRDVDPVAISSKSEPWAPGPLGPWAPALTLSTIYAPGCTLRPAPGRRPRVEAQRYVR